MIIYRKSPGNSGIIMIILLFAVSSILAVIIVIGCKGERMNSISIGEIAETTLNETVYRIEWVKPNTPPLNKYAGVRIRATDSYDSHVHPLYNLQEDISAEPPDDGDWPEVWEKISRELASKVEWFSVVAYDQGELAGMIRFYPKTLTHPKYGAWSLEQHQEEWTDKVLWIGAAYVDNRGVEDSLDTGLLRYVVYYAEQQGYSKIQALGWSDIRPYAMWGQSFPISIYENAGFSRLVKLDGSHLVALPDMLSGAHGEVIQKQVKS